MAASGGVLQTTRPVGAPRWRALAIIVVLLGVLWGAGFATGRMNAPGTEPGAIQSQPDRTIPELVRTVHHGNVKVGPSAVESGPRSIRPGDHAGGQVKRG